ncbi:hypothetical protein C8J57DRAFT_78865 [Mycena rebaudengoi]|nr:hypothetical protein C8J57DRAFT_78865 [Mycena rebaudengoi]
MRFLFPSRAKRKPKSPRLPFPRAPTDILRTSLLALKESADAFPPLKSTVGGVIALWDIAEADAWDIAHRTQTILDVVAEAVPDGSAIPAPMLESIEHFTVLLDEIRKDMEKIALRRGLSRVTSLNRDERALADMKNRLDEAYRDLTVASVLRLEMKQEQMHSTLIGMNDNVEKVSSVANDKLAPQISSILFYSRLIVFLA